MSRDDDDDDDDGRRNYSTPREKIGGLNFLHV